MVVNCLQVVELDWHMLCVLVVVFSWFLLLVLPCLMCFFAAAVLSEGEAKALSVCSQHHCKMLLQLFHWTVNRVLALDDWSHLHIGAAL